MNLRYLKVESVFEKRLKNRKRLFARCFCVCGNKKDIRMDTLKKRPNASCGCKNKEKAANRFRRHGLCKDYSSLISVHKNIVSRCENELDEAYINYGGRGIQVCKEWRDNVKCFIDWAVENGWKKGLDIDRIDNNKGYYPNNCRFVDRKRNCRNKRNNIIVKAFDEEKCIMEWVEDSRCAVNYSVLYQRLRKSKWNPEKSIITPKMLNQYK